MQLVTLPRMSSVVEPPMQYVLVVEVNVTLSLPKTLASAVAAAPLSEWDYATFVAGRVAKFRHRRTGSPFST